MLTEDDRALGHRLAAEWLDGIGETDPMVLAEHFERGGDAAAAGRHYLRAAEQALRGNDAEAAIARAQRGLAAGVPDDVRAALLGLICEAYVWRGNPVAAAEHGEKILGLATPGSAPWVRAAVLRIGYSLLTERPDVLVSTLALVRGVDPAPDAVDPTALALCIGIFILDVGGQFQLAGSSASGCTRSSSPSPPRAPSRAAGCTSPTRSPSSGSSPTPGGRTTSRARRGPRSWRRGTGAARWRRRSSWGWRCGGSGSTRTRSASCTRRRRPSRASGSPARSGR